MLAWSITQNPSYVVSPAQKLWPVYYGVASVLIISGIVMSAKETPRLLTWEPLVALGAWSYGIFLLHEPILRLARPIGVLPSQQGGQWDWLLTALLVSTLATGLAWLSYEHLEQNGRRVLGMFETGPRAREYYPHLVEYGRHTVRPDTCPVRAEPNKESFGSPHPSVAYRPPSIYSAVGDDHRRPLHGPAPRMHGL